MLLYLVLSCLSSEASDCCHNALHVHNRYTWFSGSPGTVRCTAMCANAVNVTVACDVTTASFVGSVLLVSAAVTGGVMLVGLLNAGLQVPLAVLGSVHTH